MGHYASEMMSPDPIEHERRMARECADNAWRDIGINEGDQSPIDCIAAAALDMLLKYKKKK